MIYNTAERKPFPWPVGTKIKIVRLIDDCCYMNYAEGLKGQVGTLKRIWDSGRPTFFLPQFHNAEDQKCLSLDHVEIVRLDDPDDNY